MRSSPNFLTCPNCTFEGNLSTATECELCNHSLRQDAPTRSRQRQVHKIPWQGVLIILLLVGGGNYFWQRHQIKSLTKADVSTSLKVGQSQLAQSSATSPVQLYDAMRDVPNVPNGLFNYSSAQQFAALVAHGMNDAIAQSHPKLRLRFTEPANNLPGSGSAITMLLDHQISFAETARPIEEEEYNKAKERNLTLEEIPIGFDGIVFYVNPSLPITNLSVEQLQSIFMGKVSNWKELGGPDLPIVPFSIDPKTTTSIKVLFAGLKDAKVGNNVQIVRDYTEETRRVASTPGGISYGSIATVANQKTVKTLALAKGNSKEYVQPFTDGQTNSEAIRNGSYSLTRRLFVVVRRNALLDEQAGVAYANLLLSIEGQKLINEAGFVSVRVP